MGRVLRKRVKNVGSVSKNCKNVSPGKKRRSNVLSGNVSTENNTTPKCKRVSTVRKKGKNVSSKKKRKSKVIFHNPAVENNTPAKRKIVRQCLSKKELPFKTISDNTVVDNNISTKSIVVNNLNKYVNATEVIVIKDQDSILTMKPETSTSFEGTTSNFTNDDVINITDTTIDGYENTRLHLLPSNATCSNIVDIIDITDTIVEDKNFPTVFSPMDDVQFVSESVNNNTIECIILSEDSDEEDEVKTDTNKTNDFISIKKSINIPTHSLGPLKRSYRSPLYTRNKKLKGDNLFQPYNFGSFVIDKQRISNHSQNINKFRATSATCSQKHKLSADTISAANRRPRPIIIDGLNIGHEHGNGTFSVKGIDLCVKYFASRGHKDIIAFIPKHRQGPPGSESHDILNALLKKGHICYTPSRKAKNIRMTCYDDRIILNYAHKHEGVVVSNDNYRDLYEETEAFKTIIDNRLVMVTFARDEIIVPDDQYNIRSNVVHSLSDILYFPT